MLTQSVNAATDQGFNDNPIGLVFQKHANSYMQQTLKDQPYGVAKRRAPLNRVKALRTLTLLYQKTKPKGLFACFFRTPI